MLYLTKAFINLVCHWARYEVMRGMFMWCITGCASGYQFYRMGVHHRMRIRLTVL